MAKISSIYPESSYGAAYLQANPTLQAALILNPQLRNNRQYFLYLASYSDYIINCPTYAAAKAFSEAGMPVWKTRFNAGSGLHGASTNYILGSPNSTSNSTLAASLKSYWLSFIVNLDPNLPAVSSVAKPEWPKYNKDSSKTTILDIYDKSMATSIDPDANEACRFYINQNGIVRN
jgi:carboxylesterase type B